jgi:AsmA protein
LTKGATTTEKSNVAIAGTFDTHAESPVLHMKLDAPNIPVEDIQALLPAVGVTLPAGASLQTGSVNTHLSLDGAVERLVTTGDLNLSNAKLAGFGLGSKLAALSMFTGLKSSPDTVIQTMASNIRIDPEGIRTDNLKLVVADVGTIAGSGAVGANGSLNYKLVAELAQSGAGNALSTLVSRTGIGGAVGKGIPFSVEGTTSNPQFKPDTNAMLKAGLRESGSNPAGKGQALTVGNVLGGLLNKKKQQEQ